MPTNRPVSSRAGIELAVGHQRARGWCAKFHGGGFCAKGVARNGVVKMLFEVILGPMTRENASGSQDSGFRRGIETRVVFRPRSSATWLPRKLKQSFGGSVCALPRWWTRRRPVRDGEPPRSWLPCLVSMLATRLGIEGGHALIEGGLTQKPRPLLAPAGDARGHRVSRPWAVRRAG